MITLDLNRAQTGMLTDHLVGILRQKLANLPGGSTVTLELQEARELLLELGRIGNMTPARSLGAWHLEALEELEYQIMDELDDVEDGQVEDNP